MDDGKEIEMKTETSHTRSSTFDPAEYRLEGVFDGHEEVGGYVYLTDENMDPIQGRNQRGTVDPTEAFDDEACKVDRICAHCGKRGGFIYDCYVRHLPTGELLFFGSGCVKDAELGSALEYAERRSADLRAAAERRAIINAKRAEWEAANPEQAAALDEYEQIVKDGGETDEFLDSLCKGRRDYGALTEKQTPWPTKALAKRAEWIARKAEEAAKLADAPALEDGRREITGIIRSIKWQDSDFSYAGAFKMLIELPDGNRIWGTLPSALEGVAQIDDTITLTATIERSDKDEHFGFYKRPSKATIKEEQA